jgi:hypothetical protein
MAQCSETPWRLFVRPFYLVRLLLLSGVCPVAHGARLCSARSRRLVIARPWLAPEHPDDPGWRRVREAPRPGVLHGRPSQAISTGAEMTAGENRRKVKCLSRMSRSLLRGRASSGWRRYTDLSKYC